MNSELMERFDALNTEGAMLRKCFHLLSDVSEKAATDFIDCLEGTRNFNNYLSEREAIDIVNSFVNADGTDGPKWSPDTLFAKVEGLGGTLDAMPHYNRWSLYTTMNMEHSDHSKVIEKWSEGDPTKYAEACYDLAVSQLKDVDKPHWIREYFHV